MAKLYHVFGKMRIRVFGEKHESGRFFRTESSGEKQMPQSNLCFPLMAKLYHVFGKMRIRFFGEKHESGRFFRTESGGEKVRTLIQNERAVRKEQLARCIVLCCIVWSFQEIIFGFFMPVFLLTENHYYINDIHRQASHMSWVDLRYFGMEFVHLSLRHIIINHTSPKVSGTNI